jgi:serine/threonine protein kinase/DNA-binding response OmpR family regulator
MTEKNDILLINRDKRFLEAMSSALRQSGYAVHTAMDMRTALTALASHPVGLIICDNALQDISGYEFLAYLKNDPLRDSVPFVFFVPVNDQGRASKAFKMGAIDFLVYPIEVEDFINCIREIIASLDTKKNSTAQAPSKAGIVQPGKKGEARLTERRQSIRKSTLPHLRIELSRDGILWLPGRIMNFSRSGLFVETAVLGKPGVELNIRISMPKGDTNFKGNIKHVSFDDFQKPAGVAIQIEDGEEWRQIFKYLDSLIDEAASASLNEEVNEKDGANEKDRKTLFLSDNQVKKVVNKALLSSNIIKVEEESIETRFYHSLIGKQLDNYIAVSFIGAGNMGGVFKGWDVALEREVALKVISYRLSSKKKFRKMFVKEARIISKLDHPNVAQIYHIRDTDDILYFVMEFISGDSLADIIKRGRHLNTMSGLGYLVTICQTLDFVSKKHIIHRDIKPENIMINNNGVLKIVDFGIAQMYDRNNSGVKHMGIAGSPAYISPDVIEGRPLDHRSDIYSLGATYYHALTGFPPYVGKNTDDVLLQHLGAKLTPIKVKNPKVPSTFGTIVEKMMAKDPEDRYQSYREIIRDLEALRSRAEKFRQIKNATLMLKINGKGHKIIKS